MSDAGSPRPKIRWKRLKFMKTNKTSTKTKKQTLNHEDGIKLLRQFRNGLARRCSNLRRITDASEDCRSVTESMRPYYEAFPDIKRKAEKLATDWGMNGLDAMFGEISINPESFEATSAAFYFPL